MGALTKTFFTAGLACLTILVQQPRCLSVDPLRVLHLSVHEPELNPDWGIESLTPFLQYTPERFKSGDQETILAMLDACQRGRLRGFSIPAAWFQAVRERLQGGEENRLVRNDLIIFLLADNKPEDAELLWKLAADDVNLSVLLEDRFIDWKSTIALEDWRGRLKKDKVPQENLILATRGIAATGGSEDLKSLEEILRNRKLPLAARYASAEGIGRIDSARGAELMEEVIVGNIQSDGVLSPQANGEGPAWDRWLAVSLLAGGTDSERARELLKEALQQGSATARAVALKRLGEWSADEFRKHRDLVRRDTEINVRLEVLRLTRRYPDEDGIVLLGEYLGDDQPKVRELARDELLMIADDAPLRPSVEREISNALKSDRWWQVEQALIAATSLGMKSEENQMVKLLVHPRPEVYVTAAWALRHVAESESVLAEIVELVRSETDRVFDGPTLEEPEYHRIGHLIEALSIRRVPAAKATIERYVPKNQKAGMASRMSALWGLGVYLKGKPEPKHSEAYVTIIYDKMGFGAEFGVMRYCAMIGLGNFADPNTKERIMALDEGGEVSPVAMAKKWALEQIEKRESESGASNE